jgi:hypothetical protein
MTIKLEAKRCVCINQKYLHSEKLNDKRRGSGYDLVRDVFQVLKRNK